MVHVKDNKGLNQDSRDEKKSANDILVTSIGREDRIKDKHCFCFGKLNELRFRA